jgi:iron(II)-dependent oxidoreductase
MATLPHRAPTPEGLGAWLRDARSRTLAAAEGLAPEQWMGPYHATVNPILWALGHVAWFQERWAWQRLYGQPPLGPGMDRFYDSFEVEHPARWRLPLPDRAATLGYLAEVLEHVLARLGTGAAAPDAMAYFCQLAVFHEDMHAEAMAVDRHTWEYPAPAFLAGGDGNGPSPAGQSGALPGDVEIAGHPAFPLGAAADEPFVFDNEKWGHPVAVAPFRIARAPVTQGEFAAFAAAGGYRREALWRAAGWRWRAAQALEHPTHWRPAPGGGWQARRFDRWEPLAEHRPVAQVSWHEAQAYCAWAGRRLPSEAEWELAAATDPAALRLPIPPKRRYPWGDEPPTPERANLDARRGLLDVADLPAGDSGHGCRQMLGNVWEWTQDAFYPYPGFVVDPYREYSAPWFGYSKVLRGGCCLTRARLLRNTWRNFYLPGRTDIFAGFRTCAL